MRWVAESCEATAPPPMLHIHGNADNTTLWDGDKNYTAGGYYGTLDSIGFFADLHGTGSSTIETITDKADSSIYRINRWSVDGGEAPVQLYEIDGGGHNWPSGGAFDDFDAAEVMWAFFNR